MGTLKQTWRQALQRPGFTIIVVLTLALTIGASTAIFSLFDAVLLRPLPYPSPEQLVRIRTHEPLVAGTVTDASLYDFRDWQEQARTFQGMSAYVTYGNNLTGAGPAQSVRMTFVTPGIFDLLGVKPVIGRTFTKAEDQLGGDVRKVVLSYALWQQLFNGQPSALDRTIQLRAQSYTVIGVMPPGFRAPDRSDVWVPLMARYTTYKDEWWKRRDSRFHEVIGRLKPDVSMEQATSDMGRVMHDLGRQFPETNGKVEAVVVSLRDAMTGEIRPYIMLVAGAVLLLLLIGCVNVANLFVARAAARQREMAIRAALGSTLADRIRQLLSESILLAVMGGAGGVALAWVSVQVLTGLVPVDLPDWMTFTIDARVLGFALLISVLTALLFGLAPLVSQRDLDLNEVLKQSGKGSSGGSNLAAGMRRGLVVAEVALSMVLLVCSGLMVRSFTQLMKVNTGVNTADLTVVTVGRYVPNLTPEQSLSAYSNEYRRMANALTALPGVSAVSGGNDIPYLNQPEQRRTRALYTRDRPTRDLAFRSPSQGADVMPGYFALLGIPIVEGRDFTDADTIGSLPVVIIGQHTARELFQNRSAIGQQMRWGDNAEYDPWMTVIGVVGDTKWQPAEPVPGFEIYWSHRQYPGPNMHLLIRSSGGPAALQGPIRAALAQVNPDFAIERIKSLDTIAVESVWQRRLWGFVLSAFALLALGLAALGIYGVMGYLVAQRTREIGIRMAIGAQTGEVILLVLRNGMGLVLIGCALGLVGAFAATRLMAGVLFGVGVADPVTYLAVAALLSGAALVSCALPALRASRIDPLVALREDG